MAASVITLEISNNELRIMEIAGRRITRWASLSFEEDLFVEGIIANPALFSNAVRQIMSSSGIKGKQITVSVNGLYSLARIISVPRPEEGVVTRQSIIDATNEIMPLSDDDLYLAWQNLTVVGGEQQILVVGTPRDIIDSQMEALKASGLNPRILDTKTMALARVISREPAIILNIESGSFDTVIMAHGSAETMRTTAWDEQALSLEESAERLAIALDLTVNFYNENHPDSQLPANISLFITGQMSADRELTGRLQEMTSYNIEPLAPPLEYPEHLPVSQYAVNIGLALKGRMLTEVYGGRETLLPDINLLPRAYAPWRPSARQIYFSFAIIAAIVFLLPFYQVTSAAIELTHQFETRYNTMNNLLEIRKAEIARRDPLQSAINDFNAIVDMGGEITEDLRVIRDNAAKLGIKLGSIQHGGDTISVQCQADDYRTFRQYLTALKESGRFSSLDPPPEHYPFRKEGPITLIPAKRQ